MTEHTEEERKKEVLVCHGLEPGPSVGVGVYLGRCIAFVWRRSYVGQRRVPETGCC